GLYGSELPSRRLRKTGQALASASLLEFYRWTVSHWREPEKVVIDGTDAPAVFEAGYDWSMLPDLTHTMMFIDTVSFLPNDILAKLDRASMAVSLEARVPLLDHRVVEFAWRLPLSMKIRDGSGKWILRQVLHRYVPPELVSRPKKGFSIPVSQWLRGPLREWAEELLAEDRLKREGYFNPRPIRRRWEQHANEEQGWIRNLWNILTFQAWKARWIDT
ncbi:MAG: asparagine synthase, partial [Chloroflexota bacterium]